MHYNSAGGVNSARLVGCDFYIVAKYLHLAVVSHCFAVTIANNVLTLTIFVIGAKVS